MHLRIDGTTTLRRSGYDDLDNDMARINIHADRPRFVAEDYWFEVMQPIAARVRNILAVIVARLGPETRDRSLLECLHYYLIDLITAVAQHQVRGCKSRRRLSSSSTWCIAGTRRKFRRIQEIDSLHGAGAGSPVILVHLTSPTGSCWCPRPEDLHTPGAPFVICIIGPHRARVPLHLMRSHPAETLVATGPVQPILAAQSQSCGSAAGLIR